MLAIGQDFLDIQSKKSTEWYCWFASTYSLSKMSRPILHGKLNKFGQDFLDMQYYIYYYLLLLLYLLY